MIKVTGIIFSGYQFGNFGFLQVVNLFYKTITMQEPDALFVFEELFKACTNGLLSKDSFEEALKIYNELVEVRNRLHDLEATFPSSQ